MRSRTLLLWLLGLVSIPFVLIVLIVVFAQLNDLQLRIRGYHVMSAGWELGEILAAQGGSADECLKFRSPTFDIMTPSRGEHVGMCVRKYAELKKDPSACELLMPSSYGMSCIGGARSVPQPCFLKPDLSVGGNGIRASLKECVSGPDDIQNNACCVISRVSSIIGQDDCSSLNGNPEMHDQCLNELAFKKKDPSFCQNISNNNTHSACEVQTKALRENPSICSGCVPAITLEEASAL